MKQRIVAATSVLLSATALLINTIDFISLHQEVNEISNDVSNEVHGFKVDTNEAWMELMEIQLLFISSTRPLENPFFSKDKRLSYSKFADLPQRCHCELVPRCPHSLRDPPGQPEKAGAPGQPGTYGSPGTTAKCDRHCPRRDQQLTCVKCPPGPPGVPEANGIVGLEGVPGETGPAGVQEKRGASGSPGPRGEPGRQGSSGVAGEDGLGGEWATITKLEGQRPKGPLGPRGPLKYRGASGEPGTQGASGGRGSSGKRCLNGRNGLPGNNGIRGDPGPPRQDNLHRSFSKRSYAYAVQN
ncbi:Putative cuticle collagen [Toxocara canis]|uniref:Putative cuticle collagen n=1 Tax=Toxocara canis TaxID=6265 RepID=A0A0B2VV18_TOXCA|nr:Putative cuticle collagen [Toxocara canis]